MLVFAVGAEPQILGGEKRGPLGAGPEGKTEAVDVDVGGIVEGLEGRAKGLVKDVEGFRKRVERKKKEEMGKPGWESASFDF